MHSRDALVRQNLSSRETCLIGQLDILSSANQLGDPYPASDRVLPTDYASLDKRMRFYNCAPENRAVADSHACTNFTFSSDHHVWSKLGAWIYLCRWMDHNGAILNALLKLFRLLFFKAVNKKLLTQQVILRLANIHPVAREFKLVQLFVISHRWKNFAFD